MSNIFVWKVEPMKKPKRVLMSNSLPSLQKAVGGPIEHHQIGDAFGLVCNEDNVFRDFKFNTLINDHLFYGTILLVGYKGEHFASCPLNENQLREKLPQLYALI